MQEHMWGKPLVIVSNRDSIITLLYRILIIFLQSHLHRSNLTKWKCSYKLILKCNLESTCNVMFIKFGLNDVRFCEMRTSWKITFFIGSFAFPWPGCPDNGTRYSAGYCRSDFHANQKCAGYQGWDEHLTLLCILGAQLCGVSQTVVWVLFGTDTTTCNWWQTGAHQLCQKHL